MSEFLLILVSTILVNNIVLAQLLGLYPFMGLFTELKSAVGAQTESAGDTQLEAVVGMSFATTAVMTLSAVLNYLTYRYVLLPLNAPYLQIICFIFLIAFTEQLTEILVKQFAPLLYSQFSRFLPLITLNSAVLGLALLNVKHNIHSVIEAAMTGFGTAIGFSLVLILFTALRERIALNDVPMPFKGVSIGLITAGLMSLAFMGFSGLIKL